uniref:Uncharacterized protein n=1 Tax=Odontella aurita TaxID=265563 RepID=A0A7S4MRJ8_9STRA|mmetsp:Transcript_29669/g.88005  ORF Transcript_29669/g.88005 Transcript_29669/m.88005 type:complete len:358 (+) Transcript_29669:171-1244(+)
MQVQRELMRQSAVSSGRIGCTVAFITLCCVLNVGLESAGLSIFKSLESAPTYALPSGRRKGDDGAGEVRLMEHNSTYALAANPPGTHNFSSGIGKNGNTSISDFDPREKPILAIICGSRSQSTWERLADAPLQSVLVPSLGRTIWENETTTWDTRLYVAIDEDDRFWQERYNNDTVDLGLTKPSWLTLVFASFIKDPNSTNRIPFNDIARVAFNDGAEYFVRVNDDTEFVTPGWITLGTSKLRSFDPPNVGVVGPICHQGNTEILTHDMVHRNHMIIFNETYYPEVFRNWYLDDWIDGVYKATNLGLNENRSLALPGWEVVHHLTEKRYKVHSVGEDHLEGEFHKGKDLILKYMHQV